MLKNRKIKIETIMLFFMTDNGISKISKGAKPKQYVLQKKWIERVGKSRMEAKKPLSNVILGKLIFIG